MTNKELAKEIIQDVGGKENIKSVTHCVTRLRFQLIDSGKINKERLDKLEDIMGYRNQGDQFQVIIGGKVGKIYKEVADLLPELAEGEVDVEGVEKKSIGTQLVDTLSAILVPSLAPIIGGGMLKGFLFLLTTFSWIDAEGGTYYLLNIASDCMFYFFPFLVAISAAKRFKTHEYMAVALAGVLMYPTILEVAKVGELASVKFLNLLTVPMLNYSGSIIPIILSVWLLSYVYRFLENLIPEMVTIIFTPLLTLLIMVPIMLVVIAPIGFYIGEYIAVGIGWLIDFSPWLSGFVIGATRPLLVLTGMHHALRPITQQQIATYGYSTMGPMNFMSTMGQATAAMAVYFVIKDNKMKQIALSSTISGYLGITEPALYGIITKYRSAFIGASIGGGIGGAVGAMLGAKSFAPVMPSILSIPVFLGDSAIGFLIGLATTIISTFLITVIFSKILGENEKESINSEIERVVVSPIKGDMYSISQVSDETFSSEIIGKGFAIRPENTVITSPIKGKIKTIFPTKHAIGLESDDGLEVLIHVGIDTVKLAGNHFELLCEENKLIDVGDELIKFDLKNIVSEGYDPTVMMIVTNSEQFDSIKVVHPEGEVRAKEEVMLVK